jgi:hypothetical protein
MATLPPVKLGVIIFLSFLAVLALRTSIEKRYVLPAAQATQSKRQFLMDLSLCLFAGILAMAFNMAAFGFPISSGIKLMLGCAVAGFFLSLDTKLNCKQPCAAASRAPVFHDQKVFAGCTDHHDICFHRSHSGLFTRYCLAIQNGAK